MKKKSSLFFAIFVGIFVGGIVIGLIGRALCIRNTKKYWDLQSEFFAPDTIDKVFRDEDLGQLYVCYHDSSYVNVYTESGEFLWAVSAPYMRNPYFELQEGRLIIYDDDAYIYDSADGSFIDRVRAEDLTLSYDWENERMDDFREGEFCFGTYQVYQVRPDGTLETIISRPWWYWCFHFGVCWCIAFLGAVGMGIMIFLEKKKDYKPIKKNVRFENRKVKVIFHYLRITSAVHLVYAVLDIVFGFFGGILCIGIFPLALHFIISNIIIWNMLDYISVSEEEATVLDYWKTVEIGSFIIAFLSVIVAVFIAG